MNKYIIENYFLRGSKIGNYRVCNTHVKVEGVFLYFEALVLLTLVVSEMYVSLSVENCQCCSFSQVPIEKLKWFIYLFIFGCVRSLLLRVGFL